MHLSNRLTPAAGARPLEKKVGPTVPLSLESSLALYTRSEGKLQDPCLANTAPGKLYDSLLNAAQPRLQMPGLGAEERNRMVRAGAAPLQDHQVTAGVQRRRQERLGEVLLAHQRRA